MMLSLALRRRQDELGAALHVYRNLPGPAMWLVVLAFWALAPLSILINPDPSLLLNILFPVLWGLVLAGFLLMVSGEVLVVCERGLLLGSVAPFLRPYLIRYEEITPGSVVPITRAHKYPRTTGRFYAPLTVRASLWIRNGISLVGPGPAQAARHRRLIPAMGGLRSFDGRWIWLAGTARTRPEVVTAQIAQAAARAGLDHLARATAAAPPRAMTGRSRDGARLIPGLPE